MFDWFKKKPEIPKNAGKITLSFTILKEDDFELELNLPCKENQDEKIQQCLTLVNFLQQHISPGLYPLIRLLLEKAAAMQPELLIDTKAINNLLNQIEKRKINPVVRPTEVFTLKGQ